MVQIDIAVVTRHACAFFRLFFMNNTPAPVARATREHGRHAYDSPEYAEGKRALRERGGPFLTRQRIKSCSTSFSAGYILFTEDDDSGTATESLSDESAPEDSDVDRKINVKISQPGIAFYLKVNPVKS
eukprot:COSAG02_NODE_2385_length_8989_cov_8.689314_9_plen_129_part_00